MLLYNVRLAWKSVRRHPVLSVLIVLGIALGVGVSTTFITAYHVLASDPVPGKSEVLHYVRMNSWGGPEPYREGVPPFLAYRDVREILKSGIPARSTASFASRMTVFPAQSEKSQERPFREDVLLTTSDFFAMFNVPFQYGGPWDPAADAKPEAVAVISAALNARLFGGQDSVGRTFRLDDRDFKVAGVLEPWRPRVRGYDLADGPTAEPEDVFIPMEWVGPMEVRIVGTQYNWRTPEPGEQDLPFLDRLVLGESLFLQLWVELPDEGRVKSFQSYLDAYVAEQKKLGRFPHKPDNRVTPLLAVMEELRDRAAPDQGAGGHLAALPGGGGSQPDRPVPGQVPGPGLDGGRAPGPGGEPGDDLRPAPGGVRADGAGGRLTGRAPVPGRARHPEPRLRRRSGRRAVLPARRPDDRGRRGPVARGRRHRRSLSRVADLRDPARPPSQESIGRPEETIMEFGPIFRSLLRNRARVVLIVAEVALTLAIVANCMSLILDTRAGLARESGFDDEHLVLIQSNPFAESLNDQEVLDQLVERDLQALRALPGVRAASNTVLAPWAGGGSITAVRLPGTRDEPMQTQFYSADPATFDALGIPVAQGRGFTREEYEHGTDAAPPETLPVVISKTLADAAFPDGKAVGRELAFPDESQRLLVVGIVDRFYKPLGDASDRVMLTPGRTTGFDYGTPFLVRTQGDPGAMIPEMEKALLGVEKGRFLRLRTVTDMRAESQQRDRLLVATLNGVMALLVLVTALGIVGLTSFSVAERRRQIGTRRALGASKAAIVRQFLLENWMVTSLGVVFGAALAYGLNFGLVTWVAGARLNVLVVAAGALGLWLIGVASALGPALRGAQVPPAIATRNV